MITNSERVGPVVILVFADLAALAKHVCEVVPLFTLGDHVTTEGRILHCSNFPVVTELLKNLCFGVMAHVVCVNCLYYRHRVRGNATAVVPPCRLSQAGIFKAFPCDPLAMLSESGGCHGGRYARLFHVCHFLVIE